MRPWRRMTLHFSHIFLTLVRTFTMISLLFETECNTTSGEVIRWQLDLYSVSWIDSDVIHPHLSRDVRQNETPIGKFHPKHCIGQRLGNRAFQHDCIFFILCQNWLLRAPQGDSRHYRDARPSPPGPLKPVVATMAATKRPKTSSGEPTPSTTAKTPWRR